MSYSVLDELSAMKSWLSTKIVESVREKIDAKTAEGTNWISGKIDSSELLGTMSATISDGKEWVANKLDSSEVYTAMQVKLADTIDGAFESVIQSRQARPKYLQHASDKGGVDAIIQRYALENAAISGAAGMIPGPWGMVAVVPEIASVIRNQIGMVYDIGVANGKEAYITKELLAGIVMSAVGSGVTGLLVMHGGKVLVKRTSLRVFQRIVSILAGKVTQKALKAAISKWLPVVGAAFMAWLSGHMTQRIGKLANEVFSQEIEIVNEEVTEEEITNESAALNAESARE